MQTVSGFSGTTLPSHSTFTASRESHCSQPISAGHLLVDLLAGDRAAQHVLLAYDQQAHVDEFGQNFGAGWGSRCSVNHASAFRCSRVRSNA